jgi:hypothetical protein
MNAWTPLSMQDGGGRALAAAVSRALDARQPHLLLVLRLSDRPEAAVPERVRMARSLLEAAASPAGQVLALGNGDLAVLMPRPRGGPEALSAGLAPRLARLFALPEAALSRMLACWPLDFMPGGALGYVRDRLGDAPPGLLPAEEAALDPWDCLERQVAIRLPAPQEAPRLSVLHHVLRPAAAVLRRAADGDDPFILRYLRAKVAGALVPGLDPAAPAPALARLAVSAPVHLALDPVTLATPETARLLALGADTLLITGCTTSGCVRATAVDACQTGFRPMVVREAVGDRSAAAHAQSLFDLDAKYADVVGLAETAAYLDALDRPNA